MIGTKLTPIERFDLIDAYTFVNYLIGVVGEDELALVANDLVWRSALDAGIPSKTLNRAKEFFRKPTSDYEFVGRGWAAAELLNRLWEDNDLYHGWAAGRMIQFVMNSEDWKLSSSQKAA
jgi:hypothetical protein